MCIPVGLALLFSLSFASGQVVPLPVVPSKYRTNITIAAFLPFALGDFYTFSSMEVEMAQLAVNETNADPNILPNTFVEMIRVNSYDPDGVFSYEFIDSGGYSSLAAINVAERGGI
ncbi:hypothetical protein HDU76_005113 [Blyttiomyces sp. JEL0837]|nr:hypothetical protein HDU76_005113 [Blyttiomyces sp. JEL0837]